VDGQKLKKQALTSQKSLFRELPISRAIDGITRALPIEHHLDGTRCGLTQHQLMYCRLVLFSSIYIALFFSFFFFFFFFSNPAAKQGGRVNPRLVLLIVSYY